MKKYSKIILVVLCMFPMMVFASTGSSVDIKTFLIMEAFISILISVFVLNPIAKSLAPENHKKVFCVLFIIRAIIVLYSYFYVTSDVAQYDFMALFIGIFLIVPIVKSATKKNNTLISATTQIAGTIATQNYKGITSTPSLPGAISTTTQASAQVGTASIAHESYVFPSHFARIYQLSDKEFLEQYIKLEMSKIDLNTNSKLIPAEILKRKKVVNVIFSMLVAVYISLIFFHLNIYIYVCGIIVLLGFLILTRRYNLMRYLIKEIKSRPQEKISNILMSIKNNLSVDNSKTVFLMGVLIAIIVPAVLFMNPRAMFEEMEDGNYSLRFYTLGIFQPSKVEIPGTYKGKPVVSIRGNVFANLTKVQEIVLPDSITEIRGQAFENAKSLKTVKLPSNLNTLGGGAFRNCTSLMSIEFPDNVIEIGGQAFENAKSLKTVKLPSNLNKLGGGAFKNCTSLISIEFPDTVIEIGGESFLNASSLRTVKLSKNITEIRGNTFENCTSLQYIEIPDNVTRIGGSAFRNCTSLSGVNISRNSKLEEIGSSAFRVCNSLDSIMLPSGIYVNERAFKESPTTIYYYDAYND